MRVGSPFAREDERRPLHSHGSVEITGGAIEVTLSATAGRMTVAVVDNDGKALAVATVALIDLSGVSNSANTSDENGAVSFSGLTPGDYTIYAWEDIPPAGWQDPEFRKQYSGTQVKVES